MFKVTLIGDSAGGGLALCVVMALAAAAAGRAELAPGMRTCVHIRARTHTRAHTCAHECAGVPFPRIMPRWPTAVVAFSAYADLTASLPSYDSRRQHICYDN